VKAKHHQVVTNYQSRSGSLALARVFACEVWNFYAGEALCRKNVIEINEDGDGALSIICMRLAPTWPG